jgi:broad specificity phosphatase PhoE
MSITLIRHGRPTFWSELHADPLVYGRQGLELREGYDASGIDPSSTPPPEIRAHADAARAAFVSDLRRALESAEILGLAPRAISDPLFREAALPANILPSLRLPARAWLIVARTAWLFGCSRNCESIGEVRARAERGALRLEEAARARGSVVLVAHGVINAFLERALVKRGWRSTRRIGHSYWSARVLN